MSISIGLSIAALLVSLVSVSFSIYFNAREKARLKVVSRVYRGDDREAPSIAITAINVGRRPLILRMWGGTDDQKKWAGTFLGEGKQGLRLDEHERFDLALGNCDLGLFHEDAVIEFTHLWFEDNLGRRYQIKGSRKHIKEFWSFWKARNELEASRQKIHSLITQEIKAALNAKVGASSEGK